MDSIKGTFELVGGTSQGLSWGNFVAIGVALLSFIGVLINAFSTNRMSKKINQNNNTLQEKLNQKNIDANLRAKARIEWIQNVRKTSAELISLYYELLNITDKDRLLETFISSQEKTELLILFFGPEKQHKELTPEASIESVESNEGKNDLVVEFLSKLNKDFYLYYKKALKDEKSELERIHKRRLSIMFEKPIDYVELEPLYDDDGNECRNLEPIFDPALEEEVNKIEELIEKNAMFTNNLQERLIQLRDIIRVYLKIEWNKAKKGE